MTAPGPGHARPTGLLVDLQPDAVGVDVAGPRFSWIVPAIGDAMQGRYRIQVAGSPSSFDVPAWDSGEVGSPSSTAVPYGGPRLAHSTPYWWRVRADTSAPGCWSSPSRFVTATERWGGAPIWGPDATSSWVLLRTELELPDVPVLAAFVEAAAGSPEGGQRPRSRPQGGRQYVYKLWADGQVVGRGSVRGSDDRARYHTHDVTAVLGPGRHALAALCWAEHGRWFLARLVVVLADGRRLEVPTSAAWRAASGARMLPGSADLGGGWYRAPREDWDARHEPVGWTRPGFDDGAWSPARAVDGVPDPAPAVVDVEQEVGAVLTPRRRGEGSWSIDLGRAVVGGLRLDVDGVAGARVRIRLGEELQEDGRVRHRLRTGNVYEDTWTLRDGPQSIEHWGYRAFRHVELETEEGVDLTRAVRPVVLRSTHVAGAAFASSDPDLDRVWELCRYTIEATSFDLYVDTPTRERGAYEGDAYVNQLSQYAVERSYALARYSGEYLTRRGTWPAEYRLMPVLMAWQDHLATGDDRQLRADVEHWERLHHDRFLGADGLLHKAPGSSGGGEWDADLVDWPASCRDGYERTEVNTVLNAFQAAAHAAHARIDEVLRRPVDAARHRRLAARMRAALDTHLLDGDSYRDGLGSNHHAQHATAVPVALGLAPEDRLAALGDWLGRGGMRMSVYGAQFLLEALCRAGRVDRALTLMTGAGTHGWLHLIDDLGATLVPEAWDPALKPNMSFSHAWGTAPVNVIARWVLGVRVTVPGAVAVVVEPRPGHLDRMSGTVPTIRGPVTVAYDRDDGSLRVSTPPNATARVVVHGDLGLGSRPDVRAPAGSVVDHGRDHLEIRDAPAGEVLVRRR